MMKIALKSIALVAGMLSSSLLCAQDADKFGPIEDVKAYNQALPDYKALHAIIDNKAKPVVWVITGDSITHGAMHTLGWRSYPEHWMERIKWEYKRLDDIVVDSGISGEITTGLLKQFDWRVTQFKPAVVSINLGVNDTTKIGKAQIGVYKKNLEELVSKVRRLKAIPILQVPCKLPDSAGDRAKLLVDFNKVVRAVAFKEKVLLVDHEAHWLKYASSPETMRSWMNDAIHPNGKGHMEMFKKMADDLGVFDPNSPTCKLGDKTL